MTEAEWLAATDPKPMLELLRGEWLALPQTKSNALGVSASNRKLRLWACACIRRIWQHITDDRSQKAVEVSESFADGLVNSHQLKLAYGAARRAWLKLRTIRDKNTLHSGEKNTNDAAYYASIATHALTECKYHRRYALHSTACSVLAMSAVTGDTVEAVERERLAQVNVLRCVFGNPFRPTAVAPSWLTSTVAQLAEGIYQDRAFDRMPILADALQDAGCDNDDILTHCRGAGPHVRGCWVVDLVLGKG